MSYYRQISDAGNDGDSSDDSISQSSLLNTVLKEHGYTVMKELGRGFSGRALLVADKDEDQYVVKLLNSRDTKEHAKVKNEINILKTLNCGYIVAYVDSFADDKTGLFFIVMEYCAEGDLYKRMKTQAKIGPFEEQQILDWFVQICLALQYLHNIKRNVLHRDIKPQNIFLTEDGYINLGDFESSKVMLGNYADAYTCTVPELYMSPEAHQKKYNSKSDIWSLGWILYDLCMLDVWSDIDERHIQQAYNNKGKGLYFSDKYSTNLQQLIQEMLCRDPKDRPSAETILAKSFLRETVNRHMRIPEALAQRFMTSINTFDQAYNEHYGHLEAFVKIWEKTTDSLEEVHRKCTIGCLSGSVIGAAGGITAVVGTILAPFTFGASLIVTAVGVGVGVAGGLTGATSSFANAAQQKKIRENLKEFQQSFANVSTPILDSLNTLRKILRTIQKFRDFVSDSSENVNMSCNVDTTRVLCGVELSNLGLLANIGRIAAQTARVGRAAAEAVAAVTGVLSGLLVIVDVVFIVRDSMDIDQMRQGKIDDPEKVKSSLLKSIAQMRKTHTALVGVLRNITETQRELPNYRLIANSFRSLESSNI